LNSRVESPPRFFTNRASNRRRAVFTNRASNRRRGVLKSRVESPPRRFEIARRIAAAPF
jgi:hypothetical protein